MDELVIDEIDIDIKEEEVFETEENLTKDEDLNPFEYQINNAETENSSSDKTSPEPRTLKDPKPHKCKECGESFAKKSHLNTHADTHTRLNHFKCLQCGKFFSTKAYLQRHLASHRKIKPFKCDMCGKCFSREGNLKTHLEKHSILLKCHVCGKCFTRKRYLDTHVESHWESRRIENNSCNGDKKCKI